MTKIHKLDEKIGLQILSFEFVQNGFLKGV